MLVVVGSGVACIACVGNRVGSSDACVVVLLVFVIVLLALFFVVGSC